MIKRLSQVTILVRDQDEALRWYTEKLGLKKRSDETFGPGARWLTISPGDQKDVQIVLQKPEPKLQGEESARKMLGRVGQGTTWVFATDDCRKDAVALRSRGVRIRREPEEMPWGLQAIFEDLYGNPMVLVELPGSDA